MTALRQVAANVRRRFNSPLFRALILAMIAYRLAVADGQPWWFGLLLVIAATSTGAFLGWRKARKRNR